MACVIRELYYKHGIVTHFSGPDPDVLHIMPPLIVQEHHLDYLVKSLDQVVSKGILRLSMGLLRAS
jgi:4-aminobutyrate aminotransferase-like enzyme